eukprot:TRINITY_DN89254_c0_g1_i1.p1 TRINITY_DN89254_c0_g1~~TRINITY_DN89254_c0_g1_i1.p1  ORF type:complete len:891 (+),score=120.35 TRINITY_DN89254_c0_g1_i1:146-2674(+)
MEPPSSGLGSWSSAQTSYVTNARLQSTDFLQASLQPLTELEREDNSDGNREQRQIPTFARCDRPPPGTESISYELYESKQHIAHLKQDGCISAEHNNSCCSWSRTDCTGWILLCFIGVFTGLIAVGVDISIEHIFDLRRYVNNQLVQSGCTVWEQYLTFVGLAVGFGAVAGFLVCYVQVLAAGSGIPEIKCFLNGVDFPNVVDLQTLLAKAVGIVFSVGAGLPCGKEGPMIHSGAIMGATAIRLTNGIAVKPQIASKETRDLVAAGAASGVAAAFGAPLGSVLFAIEEGASHMNPYIMARLFVAASVATLTSRFFLGPLLANLRWGWLGNKVPVSFGRFAELDYHVSELPIFALMAVVGGLFGALFNAANKRLTKWRQRRVGPRGHKRFLEVLFVTFMLASLNFWVVAVSYEQPMMVKEEIGANSEPGDDKYVGMTRSLFRHSGSQAMKSLFHEKDDFEIGYLLLFAVVNLVSSCWTYGIGVPSGLFVPSLLTGAAFGRIAGQLVKTYFPLTGEHGIWAHPGIYALVGACSMLAGTARITISLAMILMETCGDSEFGLPIFLSVMAAKWTGDAFNRGIYDMHIVELKKVPLLETLPEPHMIALQVRDIMARDVVTFDLITEVRNLVDVLTNCNHHSFPVVYPGTRRLAGMLSQDVIRRILELGEEYDIFNKLGASSAGIPYAAMAQGIVSFKYETPPEYLEAVSDHLDKRVDLRYYINRNGLSVSKHASVHCCYNLFRQLGLRHLPVIDRDGTVCGVITRKDLILHEQEHDLLRDCGECAKGADSDEDEGSALGDDDYSPYLDPDAVENQDAEAEGELPTELTKCSTRHLDDAQRGMGGAAM